MAEVEVAQPKSPSKTRSLEKDNADSQKEVDGNPEAKVGKKDGGILLSSASLLYSP